VEPLLVRAARREPVERTPVWFMRQAGRSLPEYREIRERHAFFEINRSAELTTEVTLQPVRRHGVDAAVMFADIMTPVLAMGLDVELVEGVGPVVAEPVRSLAAVERLRVPDPADTVAPLLEAIGIVRRELDPEQAVVGFCGGPFTVAGYIVEGKPSREFSVTKALMYREPEVWGALLDKLADAFAAYAVAQARAGADVVQLFDSWVGALSPADYAEFVAPWSGRVLAALRDAGVPTIHFGTGTATLLSSMAATGGDVIGLDWRVPLDEGWAAVGEERGVQGNLDPAVLLGPWKRVEAAVRDVLARAGGRQGHVFNLGHGVLPRTDPDVLGRVRELVHAETSSSADGLWTESHTSGTPA
jgi:uroporphyrinogen decarboxylase